MASVRIEYQQVKTGICAERKAVGQITYPTHQAGLFSLWIGSAWYPASRPVVHRCWQWPQQHRVSRLRPLPPRAFAADNCREATPRRVFDRCFVREIRDTTWARHSMECRQSNTVKHVVFPEFQILQLCFHPVSFVYVQWGQVLKAMQSNQIMHCKPTC